MTADDLARPRVMHFVHVDLQLVPQYERLGWKREGIKIGMDYESATLCWDGDVPIYPDGAQ